MKKTILFALALSLPLVQAVRADNQDNRHRHRRQVEEATQTTSRAPARAPQRATSQRAAIQQPVRRHVTPTTRHASAATQHASTSSRHTSSAAQHAAALNARRSVAERSYRQPVQHNLGNNFSRNGDRSLNNNGERNRNANATVNVSRNRNNGSHRSYNRNSFEVARSRVIHQRHDRGWWRSHYNTTFVLFGGGYYYWDAGYWYPAYGYSPIYNNYIYDEPIYGYNNLAPGQVLENVQLALRDLGYYRGAIDGLIGPRTRGALAAFQRDHGLLQTAAVDEPTLVELGLA